MNLIRVSSLRIKERRTNPINDFLFPQHLAVVVLPSKSACLSPVIIMWKALFLLCILAAFADRSTDAAKILCAFPTPSRAQMAVAGPLFEGLAVRGHKVTVLSSFPREKPLKNYRDVTVKVDHLLEGGAFTINHCRSIAHPVIRIIPHMPVTQTRCGA